jgi:hypothetical protein
MRRSSCHSVALLKTEKGVIPVSKSKGASGGTARVAASCPKGLGMALVVCHI